MIIFAEIPGQKLIRSCIPLRQRTWSMTLAESTTQTHRTWRTEISQSIFSSVGSWQNQWNWRLSIVSVLSSNGKSRQRQINCVERKGNDVVVDNRWIVPYCPLLSKTFSIHCNDEHWNSIKSIKYVFKYVKKESDMTIFGIVDLNASDEVTKFQLERYVSRNKAIWRLFSFSIYKRHPTVVHLVVHLEND